jgi:hypothetical protein
MFLAPSRPKISSLLLTVLQYGSTGLGRGFGASFSSLSVVAGCL